MFVCRKNAMRRNFEFFAIKVRYWPSKVKLWNRHLIALMTSDHDQQGLSQGHQGCFYFLADFTQFCDLFLQFSKEKAGNA